MRIIYAGYVACIGQMVSIHKISIGNAERKPPINGPSLRLEYKDMNPEETGRIYLAQRTSLLTFITNPQLP
jgi:hypothetical protein